MSKKIEITEENGDNRLKHFIIGHIVYLCLNFDPIEEMASQYSEEASWSNVYKLLQLYWILLQKIKHGEIKLTDSSNDNKENRIIE